MFGLVFVGFVWLGWRWVSARVTVSETSASFRGVYRTSRVDIGEVAECQSTPFRRSRVLRLVRSDGSTMAVPWVLQGSLKAVDELEDELQVLGVLPGDGDSP